MLCKRPCCPSYHLSVAGGWGQQPRRAAVPPIPARGTIQSASASHSARCNKGRPEQAAYQRGPLVLSCSRPKRCRVRQSSNCDAPIGRELRSQDWSNRWWTYRRRSIAPSRCQRQGRGTGTTSGYLRSTYQIAACGSASPDIFPCKALNPPTIIPGTAARLDGKPRA